MERNRIIAEAGIARFIGVYQADGGLRGELAYVVGKVTGRHHCTLCDVTHSHVRRRASWDAFVDELPVPFALVHLNERDAAVEAATEGRTPIVIAELATGAFVTLIGASALEGIDGSVNAFIETFDAELSRLGNA
jgi:hypothetical protein